MSVEDLDSIAVLKAWLLEHGAYIHPDVVFEPVDSGYNIIAGNDVPRDATVVSVPFSLAITPTLSRSALFNVPQSDGALLETWSERQLECTYICMHWILDESSATESFSHGPYLATLPSAEKLRTPLHFSDVELEAFQGSNLFGATLDRRREWQAEWEQCSVFVNAASPVWAEKFTWERYLTAATYLSSRAFPSTVLSPTPSLITTPTSHPVLLPGIDALNHARGHPVSWIVSSPPPVTSSPSPQPEPHISLVIHTLTPRGSELLNNYGPKPNAELILGYGFSLPNNPDDTIVLKIGGPSASSSASGSGGAAAGKWEVGRNARGAEPVWDAILAAVVAQNAEEDDEGGDENEAGNAVIEDELCAADMLAEMAQSLYDRLPPFPPPPERASEMRPEVLLMLEHYVEGQKDILQALIAFARAKEADALERAREEGLDIVAEEEEEED